MELDGEITTSPTARPMALRVSVPVRLQFGAGFGRSGADTRKTVVLDIMGYTNGTIGCTTPTIEDRAESALSDPSENQLGPFVRDSETSRKAALDAYPRQGNQRSRILGKLRSSGPATREELAVLLMLSENTIRPRVKELIEGGWIEETDHTRETSRGSEATLLDVTRKAREHFAIELQRNAGGFQ